MTMQIESSVPARTSQTWRPLHAYLMAVVCLVIGCAIGYLIRGSAPPKTTNITAVAPSGNGGPVPASAANGAAAPAQMPSLDDMKRMAEKQAQPLLTELEKKPTDAALLNKTALTYKAAHQFEKAAEYFKKSLESDPKNVAVRDDYASCLYFLGDVDGALTQLNKSLTFDPKHAGTLFNIGMIEWRGKNDVDAAVTSWEKLLKLNPGLPQKDKENVQHLIEVAKQSKAPVAEKQ
jgi:tetratricopeptide (TPR) repeat protein